MSLYPVILPLGEMGRAQERWITLDDTVVAVNVSTGPGTGEGGENHTYYVHHAWSDRSHLPSSGVMMTTGLLKGPSPASFTALTLNW